METCLICGQEYDELLDPDHEEECEARFTEDTDMETKPIPELETILQGLLNENED